MENEEIKKNKGRNIYDIFGYELAHRPVKPAFRGFDFSDVLPKTKSIHRNQHRFYTDLEKGGFVLHKPPRADNFWTHPKIGVFKKLDQVEKHVKGKQ